MDCLQNNQCLCIHLHRSADPTGMSIQRRREPRAEHPCSHWPRNQLCSTFPRGKQNLRWQRAALPQINVGAVGKISRVILQIRQKMMLPVPSLCTVKTRTCKGGESMDPESAKRNFFPHVSSAIKNHHKNTALPFVRRKIPRVQQTAKFFMFKFPLAAALRSIPASPTARGTQPSPRAPDPRWQIFLSSSGSVASSAAQRASKSCEKRAFLKKKYRTRSVNRG